MAMEKHHDEPGSPAWHARRARCFNAGDAAAMLGCHPSGVTRTQLLHALHTGIEREFSDFVQERVIAPGHRVEALWRPIAEAIIGEDLQVYGASVDVGLSRPLGASLDAATFLDDTLGECKSANDALRAALPHTGRDSHERNDARQLPKGYRVQMEQQQLVTGATRTLFSACGFDEVGEVIEERHCWYESDPALRAEILAGWKQFDADLAAYTPPTASTVEKVVAEPVEALPAVNVTVTGALTLHDNFDAFEKALRHFLEHRLIRQPKTDQDFADLDAQIKAMKGAEDALDAAEAQMLAQVESVDERKRRKDMLKKLTRENRLMAEKLLASEKERRRGELVSEGIEFLRAHVARLNTRLGAQLMPASATAVDFGLAIKGLRTLASMQNAIDTKLAAAKIAANETADRIEENLKTLAAVAPEHAALFPDRSAIVLKAPEDLQTLVRARVAEHDAAVKRRAEEAAEKERIRIRAEEEARAERRAQVQARIDGIATAGAGVTDSALIARAIRTLQACTLTPELLDDRVQEAAQARVKRLEELEIALADAQEREARERRQREEAAAAQRQQGGSVATGPAIEREGVESFHPAANATVHPLPTRAPAAPSARIPLGEVNKRLAVGGVEPNFSAAFLAALGFQPEAVERGSKLYAEHNLPLICSVLAQHFAAVLGAKEAA